MDTQTLITKLENFDPDTPARFYCPQHKKYYYFAWWGRPHKDIFVIILNENCPATGLNYKDLIRKLRLHLDKEVRFVDIISTTKFRAQ